MLSIQNSFTGQKAPMNLNGFFELNIPHIKNEIFGRLNISERVKLACASKVCYSAYLETFNLNRSIRGESIRLIFSKAGSQLKEIKRSTTQLKEETANEMEQALESLYIRNVYTGSYQDTQVRFYSLLSRTISACVLFQSTWYPGYLRIKSVADRFDECISYAQEASPEMSRELMRRSELVSNAKLKIRAKEREFKEIILSDIFLIIPFINYLLEYKSNDFWVMCGVVIVQILVCTIKMSKSKLALSEVLGEYPRVKSAINTFEVVEGNLNMVKKYTDEVINILNSMNNFIEYEHLSTENEVFPSKYIEGQEDRNNANKILQQLSEALVNMRQISLEGRPA